jgi:hypothetical protein
MGYGDDSQSDSSRESTRGLFDMTEEDNQLFNRLVHWPTWFQLDPLTCKFPRLVPYKGTIMQGHE